MKTRRNTYEVNARFAGAPGLKPHVASTYGAILAIVNIGTKEAYDIIDVDKMKQFLNSIKNNMDQEFD